MKTRHRPKRLSKTQLRTYQLILRKLGMANIGKRAYLLTLFIASYFFIPVLAANPFQAQTELSLRYDIADNRDGRWQYRLRFRPQLQFNEQLSLNAFIVTGDSYSSNYNTLDNDSSHNFNFRHLFLRVDDRFGKTEFGVIPPYKGRVSSTGLSQDGWVVGLRRTFISNEGNILEFVAGELSQIDDPKPFKGINNLNYLEMEYSAFIGDRFSYEIAGERVLSKNYLRGELRYDITQQMTLANELVVSNGDDAYKYVLKIEGDTEHPLLDDYALYYTYAGNNFGQRAELTEDFIEYGHGVTLELENAITDRVTTFWKSEKTENNWRISLGIEYEI